MPVYGVLIDHEEGRFLYDTGFDKEIVDTVLSGNARQSDRQTLPGQLDLIGLRTDQISHVVNSHYHLDHVGGTSCASMRRRCAHACEMEAAANPAPFEEMGYCDMSFAPGLRGAASGHDYANDIYTPKFQLLRGDQEIAKGVTLFETPEHTDGHCSLMVRLAGRRPMLFRGDACYDKRGMDENRISSSHVDPRASFRSLDRLRQLARDHDAELFYAHDAISWKTWTPAPGFYI